MENIKNKEWIEIDDSTSQYRKELDENTFSLIEYNSGWGDKHIVHHNVICLEGYSEEQFEDAISGYYDSIEDVKENAKDTGENYKGIIAECIFEQEQFDESIFHIVFEGEDGEQAAIDFIEDWIKNN